MTDTNKQAEKIVDWLSIQHYQGEPLLHAIVCCDWVSRQHLISSIKRLLDEQE